MRGGTGVVATPQSVQAAQAFGQDIAAVFDTPAMGEARVGKNATFSQWPVCTNVTTKMCMACTGPLSSRVVIETMGYSIRTIGWRQVHFLFGEPPQTAARIVAADTVLACNSVASPATRGRASLTAFDARVVGSAMLT
jgi:hypothetical protein